MVAPFILTCNMFPFIPVQPFVFHIDVSLSLFNLLVFLRIAHLAKYGQTRYD